MPHGQDKLSIAACEATTREVPHEQGVLFGTASKVSIDEGEAFPPSVGQVTGDEEGS